MCIPENRIMFMCKNQSIFFYILLGCWQRIWVLWSLLLKMNSHVIFVYIVWDAVSRFTKNYMDAGRQPHNDSEICEMVMNE